MNYLELSFSFLDKGGFADIVDVRLNEIEFEIIREKSERLNLKFISHKNKNKWNLLHFTN
tara:strand:+ start:42 stop:221 length:180 start_codon:yes stop_codon:yes gene_type:complete